MYLGESTKSEQDGEALSQQPVNNFILGSGKKIYVSICRKLFVRRKRKEGKSSKSHKLTTSRLRMF